jgi:hypothetical protein
MPKEYSGSCLCKNITFTAKGEPGFPHLCSCHMCQKWSGAPTVAWVEFPLETFKWDGPGGKPAFYRSSQNTQRCFCQNCGGTLGALDDGSESIGITIASLHKPDLIIPGKQHSFEESAPPWWKVTITHPSSKK